MDEEEKKMKENILHRLPAKSLFRFTTVCKEWKSTITSALFPRHQATSFRSISGFFYQSESGVPSFLSLGPAYGVPDPLLTFLPEPVYVRSSCSGLLCCQGRTSNDKTYYICNPVTKKWTQLPKSNEDHKADPAVVLVVGQSTISSSVFAVAEYRLVCAFPFVLYTGYEYKSGYKFDVYCSTTRSWKSDPDEFLRDENISLQPKSGFHVNKTVYWHSNDGRVVAFDLGTNRVRIRPRVDGILGSINGEVCAGVISKEQRLVVKVLSNPLFDIFTEEFDSLNDDDTWKAKSFDVALHSEFSSDDALTFSGGGLVFLGGDVLLLSKGNIFFSSDLKEKTSTCLGEVSIGKERRMVPYINSLVDLVGQVSQ